MNIFSTRNSQKLAGAVARELRQNLSPVKISNFPDGELRLLLPQKVRGTVFIIGNVGPSAEDLAECLLLAGALKKSGAKKVIGVVPYLGYGRQDHASFATEVPIFSVVAKQLELVFDALIIVDPHMKEPRNFFSIPVRLVEPLSTLVAAISNLPKVCTVLAPDRAALDRAKAAAKLIGAKNIAWIDKKRPAPGIARATKLHGALRGHVVIVDDMVDSGGTIIEALRFVRRQNLSASVVATHLVRFLPPAFRAMKKVGVREFIFSDSMRLEAPKDLKIVSLVKLLAAAIKKIKQ